MFCAWHQHFVCFVLCFCHVFVVVLVFCVFSNGPTYLVLCGSIRFDSAVLAVSFYLFDFVVFVVLFLFIVCLPACVSCVCFLIICLVSCLVRLLDS